MCKATIGYHAHIEIYLLYSLRGTILGPLPYSGLQAKVAAKNNLAAWIPCAGHSLNLTQSSCRVLHSCGEFLRHSGVCIFFTASTHRYEVLSNVLKSADRSVCVPKRINTIRSSCRIYASKAFVQGYPEIKNALAEFADNPNEVPKVRSESNDVYERICACWKLEFIQYFGTTY